MTISVLTLPAIPDARISLEDTYGHVVVLTDDSGVVYTLDMTTPDRASWTVSWGGETDRLNGIKPLLVDPGARDRLHTKERLVFTT